MLSRNTLITVAAKSSILLLNFALVIFTTHFWGSAGRGEIALVIANISLITLLSNVSCGSTISFHAPRVELNLLLLTSGVGATIISLSGAVVFSLIIGFRYFIYLFLISLFLSLNTSISSYWLGKSNFKIYNLLTFLLPFLIIVSLTFIFFILKKTSINTYFTAYLSATALLLVFGTVSLAGRRPPDLHLINISGIKNILSYGVRNELNSIIQFVSYRLSYFLIARFLGLNSLGIFSVAVGIAEAFWVISRSFSAVHFSNVINSGDYLTARKETSRLARQSFIITLLLLVISILVPENWYRFIFGEEFGEIKKFILYIIPGIIAVAASNLYDQYFSGIGNLRVIRNKFLIGLVSIAIIMPLIISKYKLPGICISINISYIMSAIYIWIKFKREATPSSLLQS